MANDPTKETAKNLDQANKKAKEYKKTLEEILGVTKQLNEDSGAYTDRVLKASDAFERDLRTKIDMADLASDEVESAMLLNELKEHSNMLSEQANAMADSSDPKVQERFRIAQEQLSVINGEIDAREKSGQVAKKYSAADLKAKKELDGVMSSIADHTGIFQTPDSSGFVGSMFKVASTMKEAHERGEMFTGSLKKYFNLTNFATSIVTKTIESTIALAAALDQSNAQFAAATGMGDRYLGALSSMQMEGNILGVTFQNAGNALKGLTENMVGFVNMSEQAKVNLAMNVAQFERIGIDANTSAESINNFTLNMGKSEQQAMAMTQELAMMGQSAGISAGKMTKDFQTAFKSLAVYGEKSIEVFQGLASAARAAGVEVSSLTSLAGKFDTFAGSAETVGKLNALLGSQLSSTEMLMMTEDKRVETLVQQVQAQGVNFKDMNKFQQMAIANAAGISDMNEAQRIFGMNMKDYKKYQKDMQKQEDIQKRFNEAVEATLPLQEKMQIFITNFAQGIQPLLGFIEGLIDGLIYLTSNKIVMGIVSLVSAFYLLKFALFGGLEIMRRLPGATKLATAAKGALLAATEAEIAAEVVNDVQKTKTIAKNELEAASNVKNAGSKNVSAAGSLNLGTASAVGGNMAGAGALGMLKFALAVLMIGAGVGMAAVGIGYMVSSFTELATVGPEAVASLTAFSLALGALMMSGGMGLFGAGGLMLGMMVIKDGLQEIGKVLEDNRALQEGLENLALVSTGRGAAAMKAGGATLAGDLKAAVSAAMTQKLEVVIKLKDSALKDMVENVVVNSITSDGRVAAAVAKIS